MQQSNIIFGVILVAYIVFITQRGELPTYLTLLRGGGKQPNISKSPISTTGSGTFGSIISGGLNNVLKSIF